MLSTLTTVLALVLSGAALLIAWWQLILQRDAAGGRGVILDIKRNSRNIDNRTTPATITDNFRVLVKTVGNDRHEVTLHLQRNDIELVQGDVGYVERPATVHRMTCEDEPLIWKFSVDHEVGKSVQCVLMWVEPFGDGIRTGAFRRGLSSAYQDDTDFEEWRWYRFFRARRRCESWCSEHGPAWFRERAGRPRRIGAWRPYQLRPLQPGQSPRNAGAMPTRRRRAWWWCL